MTPPPSPSEPRPSGRLKQLKLATFIAMRIARSKRSSTLSLVTLISIIGIACGVMALTVVLAVTDGFRAAFQERILGVFPHLVVMRNSSAFGDYESVLDTLRETPGVVGATPLTGDEMMVAHDAIGDEAGQFRAGATVQGIDLASVRSVLDIDRLMKKGSLKDLEEAPEVRLDKGVTLSNPVEGAALTLVRFADDAPPLVLNDEMTRPDTDHCRVKVLDLRTNRTPVELTPRDGIAKSVYELTEPVVLNSDGRAWSRELELPIGTWELVATRENIILENARAYAIILWHPRKGSVEAMLLTEPTEPRRAERQASVRVVDARTEGSPPLPWRADDKVLATTNSGQSSGYFQVSARLPGVILGQTLATRLHADLEAELTFVTPLRGLDNKMVGPFGMMPSSTRFRVVGVFEAGFHDHDARLALTNLEVSQRFMNRGRMIRTIAVKTTSLLDLDRTKSAIKRALDPIPFEDLIDRTLTLERKLAELTRDLDPRIAAPSPSAPFVGMLRNVSNAVGLLKFNGAGSIRPNRFQVIDWREKNINLFNALELQKVVLTIFFFIIILVGSFVVVGSQIMVVHEKTPDIAILKAMGATSGLVRLVFTLQGLFVAVIGLLVGLGLGLGFSGLIDAVEYELESSIYLIDHLPAVVDGGELVLIALGTLACTLLTTQISAGRAASKSPVAGLRQVD